MHLINYNVSRFFCENFSVAIKHMHETLDEKAKARQICDELFEMSFKDDLPSRQVILADILHALYASSGTPMVEELGPK